MPAHGVFGFCISLLPSVNAATFSVWLKETYLIFPKEAVNEIMFLPNSCVTGLDELLKSSALSKVVGFLQQNSLKASGLT